jgi:hypothetical protein
MLSPKITLFYQIPSFSAKIPEMQIFFILRHNTCIYAELQIYRFWADISVFVNALIGFELVASSLTQTL